MYFIIPTLNDEVAFISKQRAIEYIMNNYACNHKEELDEIVEFLPDYDLLTTEQQEYIG